MPGTYRRACTTRTFTLTLRAVDPLTGWSPESPLVGLLYPNDATGRGQGSVSYRIKPKENLATGTQITNRARIYFDFNDPIDTPQVLNTLDADGPSSRLTTPSITTTDTNLKLNWTGTDDAGGSGIASYSVYVSVDGGEYLQFVFGTKDIAATFAASPGHTYAFYTVATDQVGHVELPPASPDTIITIPAVYPWNNPKNALDADADGSVSPLDVLVIINRINLFGSGFLNPNTASNPPPYFDCDADGFVSPLDVLVVINFINRRGSGEGEAYSQVFPLATPIINPSSVTEGTFQSRREELQRRIELYDIDRSFVSFVNTGVSRSHSLLDVRNSRPIMERTSLSKTRPRPVKSEKVDFEEILDLLSNDQLRQT